MEAILKRDDDAELLVGADGNMILITTEPASQMIEHCVDLSEPSLGQKILDSIADPTLVETAPVQNATVRILFYRFLAHMIFLCGALFAVLLVSEFSVSFLPWAVQWSLVVCLFVVMCGFYAAMLFANWSGWNWMATLSLLFVWGFFGCIWLGVLSAIVNSNVFIQMLLILAAESMTTVLSIVVYPHRNINPLKVMFASACIAILVWAICLIRVYATQTWLGSVFLLTTLLGVPYNYFGMHECLDARYSLDISSSVKNIVGFYGMIPYYFILSRQQYQADGAINSESQ